MRFRLVLVFLGVSVTADQSELHMEPIVRPELCDTFAQLGDILTVHYNGTFGNDSSLFDSRFGRRAARQLYKKKRRGSQD